MVLRKRCNLEKIALTLKFWKKYHFFLVRGEITAVFGKIEMTFYPQKPFDNTFRLVIPLLLAIGTPNLVL